MVKPDLSVQIGSLRLKNPVLTASGTFGYGLEFNEYFDIGLLGGIATKGLSPKPREGNPPQRIAETPAGMLNTIGLQNVGVDAFIAEKLPELVPRNWTNAIPGLLQAPSPMEKASMFFSAISGSFRTTSRDRSVGAFPSALSTMRTVWELLRLSSTTCWCSSVTRPPAPS